MKLFEKVWAKSEEQNAKMVLVYPNGSSVLCTDEDATKKILTPDAVNFFKKGMLMIVTENGMFVPISCTVSSNVATLTCVVDSTGASLVEYTTTAPTA